jgi:hypothetical protein
VIAIEEPNDYAAEVPFTLPLATDPITGLTGYVFTLGEVQIKPPGGAWVNVALDKIVEIGYGRFAARLTTTQRATAGVVAIYATATGCQPFRGTEVIGTLGGDISVEGDGYLMAYLPDDADPVYGTPASGAFSALSGALVRVAWPNAAYVSLDPTLVVEFGFGMYGIPVSSVDTALRGKAYYYLDATGYQRFEGYSTILGTGPAAAVVVPAPVAVAAPAAQALATSDHVQAAFNRLCEYSKYRLA